MTEVIVSCAHCGKRYKGPAGPRKYKCKQCSNLFSFPETSRIPYEGSLLCSCCWTGVAASADLTECPVCGQKISTAHGGRAVLNAMPVHAAQFPPEESNGTRPPPRASASTSSRSSQPAQRSTSMEASSSMAASSAMGTSPAQISASADEGSSQPDVPARHDDGREDGSAEFPKQRAVLEAKIDELQARLNLWQESQAMALRERDDAAKARRHFELQVADLQAQLASAQEAQTRQALELAQLAPLQSELQRVREECKLAMAERAEYESRSKCATARMETVQAEFAALRAERDAERFRADGERTRLIETRMRLAQFQELAVAALRPVADQHQRINQALSDEISGLLEQAHAAQRDYQQRRARLAALEDDMLEQLTNVAREAELILSGSFSGGNDAALPLATEPVNAVEEAASNHAAENGDTLAPAPLLPAPMDGNPLCEQLPAAGE